MRSTVSRLALPIAFAIAVATAAPAVAQDVGYNAMPGIDFTKFKTYKWVKIEGAQYPDQITDSQIKQAVDTELAAKGLSATTGETADLFVGYQVAIDKEKQWNSYNTGGMGWGWGGGYYGGAYGGSTTTTTSQTIVVGTLGLDFYDPAAKQLLWRGQATKTLDTNAKPEKRTKNLNKAVKKLLKNYPPPPKKK